MRPRRHYLRFAVTLLSAAGLAALLAPGAAAEFGPIQLVSKSPKEQAEVGKEPALSEDGDFVAFDGMLGGHSGIFRKNLVSGALTLVVEGAAEAPSISAEGRYVSFTTTQSLEPIADTQAGSKDVYVADLSTTPPSYRLVSELEVEGQPQRMSGSSNAAPRVALSADGSEVAFVNEGEVYVRRLTGPEAEPILITAKREPISGGMTEEPVLGGGAYQAAGAALSADGNVVAWVGERLPQQVPLLGDEEEAIAAIEAGFEKTYHEPLWREVPDGAVAPPTRRIVGGGDPLAPGCPRDGTLSEAACTGPFPSLTRDHAWEPVAERGVGKGWGINLPQLSADGDTVAVIGSPEEIEDLFVIDMDPGLSRSEAMRQLTRWTNPIPSSSKGVRPLFEAPEYQVYAAPIRECAISPDGEHIAFTTQRQNFPLAPPTLVTAKPVPFPTAAELYQVNLEGETIERVTPGPGTGVSRAGVERQLGESTFGAAAPSYSADDRTIAFASGASNLVSGDANGSSDVFTVESEPPAVVQPSTISPPPSSTSIRPAWRLTAHAVSRPDGAVRVVASVPGAGTLRVGATSQLGSAANSRKVSAAHRRARVAGIVRLELDLTRRLRKLAHRKGGLYTSLRVHFSGPGGKPLGQRLSARFRIHKPAPSAKKGRRG